MRTVTGILYIGEGLLNLKNAKFELTPLNIGRLILRRQMKKAGFKFDPASRTKWLQEDLEYRNEISEDIQIESIDQMIDAFVDDLLYCNAPHIIGTNNTQVDSSYVQEVASALVSMLEDENPPDSQSDKIKTSGLITKL